MTTTIEQYTALKNEVARHAHLYYVLDKPEISDGAYDDLYRELEAVERDNPEFRSPDSPTHRVGGAMLSAFAPFVHDRPMLSLGNSMDAAKAAAFGNRVAEELGQPETDVVYTGEPKYDGLSLSAIYRYGVFDSAGTRGDGTTGETVTEQVKTIVNFPLTIPNKAERVEVRGEVLMTKVAFARLNEKQAALGEEPYANTRNAAAGSLRQLDPKVTASRRLQFFAYGFGVCTGLDLPDAHWEVLSLLKALGFSVDENVQLVYGTQGILDMFQAMVKKRASLPFDIDGVVFKVNSRTQQNELGFASKTPNWATACKFEAEEAMTLCEAIDIQIGRTGAATPVARLATVFVGGVNVTNATLHNENEVQRKDVRIGDRVIVRRAGDVIPEIVRSLPELRTEDLPVWTMPTSCPDCGSPLHKEDEEKSVIRCTGGLKCPSQRLNAITHFCSRLAMNIEDMGESTIVKLLEHNMLDRPSGLFTLTVEQLQSLPGFAKASATKRVNFIAGACAPLLNRFVFALGIPNVGESTAKALAKRFKSFSAIRVATEEELLAMEDVGPITAGSIRAFFDNADNAVELDKMLAFVTPQDAETSAHVASIVDKVFVITGTLSHDREHYVARIEAAGGKVSGSVSKKTNFLLAGASAGSKLKKAEGIEGLQILDEAAFEALMGS